MTGRQSTRSGRTRSRDRPARRARRPGRPPASSLDTRSGPRRGCRAGVLVERPSSKGRRDPRRRSRLPPERAPAGGLAAVKLSRPGGEAVSSRIQRRPTPRAAGARARRVKLRAGAEPVTTSRPTTLTGAATRLFSSQSHLLGDGAGRVGDHDGIALGRRPGRDTCLDMASTRTFRTTSGRTRRRRQLERPRRRRQRVDFHCHGQPRRRPTAGSSTSTGDGSRRREDCPARIAADSNNGARRSRGRAGASTRTPGSGGRHDLAAAFATFTGGFAEAAGLPARTTALGEAEQQLGPERRERGAAALDGERGSRRLTDLIHTGCALHIARLLRASGARRH